MLEQLLAFLCQCFAMREADYAQIRAQLPMLLRDKGAGAKAITMRSEPVSPVTMVGDVAVIDVAGPLSKHPSIMRLFGYEDRATLVEIEQAALSVAADSKVRGVIFRFDTPGGTVSGTEAAGKAIARCTAAKPTVALVTDMACSAGYWLASQCGTIVANASADVGSIGVVAGLYDMSEMLKEYGVEAVVARSTPLKGIGMLGGKVTDEQKAELDRWVQASADVFIDAVAAGRRVDGKKAREWATARVWSGNEAKALGLIDVVGGFDEAMAALNSAAAPSVRGGVAAQDVNTVADGRPKHGEHTMMGKLLRAYLVTLGLAANASEAQAWEKYNSLKGDERTTADAKKAADAAEAAQLAQAGGVDAGGQQTNAQAGASQQASPSASEQAPNPPADVDTVPTATRGLSRSAIQGFAELAGMAGDDLNQFVAYHTLKVSDEATVRAAAAQHLEAQMPAIGSSRTTVGDDGRESLAAAVEDVMTERMGGVVEEPHARCSEFEYLSNVEVGRRFLTQLGVPSAGSMHPQQVATHLFDRMSLAGVIGSVALSHGTSDFGGVLGASANKTLVMAFDDEESTYQAWTQSESLPNLLQHTEYQLSGVPRPPRVLEGQEYGLTTFAENGEVKQVYKYGHMAVLTLEMFINDTLGAFSDQMLDFAGASKQLRNYISYQALINPPTMQEDSTAFFDAGHNNLNQGGAAALATAPLKAMRSAMRLQKGLAPGSNGETPRNLAITPTFLLVPEELADDADTLVNSRVKVGGTNDEPNSKFLRTLVPISDPELSDASSTAYYLTGPKRKAPVKSLMLRGYERPTVTRQNVSRTDGLEYKLRDFAGAAAVRWRAAQKNDGA